MPASEIHKLRLFFEMPVKAERMRNKMAAGPGDSVLEALSMFFRPSAGYRLTGGWSCRV